MFEFEDSKLGRVKILNVTEARSSIASIMNDMEFNYIITKNNKPIRVIINYDSYKKTKDQALRLSPIDGRHTRLGFAVVHFFAAGIDGEKRRYADEKNQSL